MCFGYSFINVRTVIGVASGMQVATKATSHVARLSFAASAMVRLGANCIVDMEKYIAGLPSAGATAVIVLWYLRGQSQLCTYMGRPSSAHSLDKYRTGLVESWRVVSGGSSQKYCSSKLNL
jgi:hypothetical protein